jgi:O-antigen/teichoic acid export membrane protein
MGAHRTGTTLKEWSGQHLAFARLFSSAVFSQALLSASSFAVGLIFLRNTGAAQYGYYVLALNAVMLLASLQNAFLGPPLAIRMSSLDASGRGQLVGGLLREQRRISACLGLVGVVVALVLWQASVLDHHSLPLVLATVGAGLALIGREYFRMVLLAHRLPHDVLRIDLVYVALLLAGAFAATLMPLPAIAAICALGLAAAVSGWLLARALHHRHPWTGQAMPGLLRNIAPLAAWSTAGAAIHWAFSQGYIYLVAGTLDIAAVAAIAATRMLMMPVNLLSTGIGSLMLPTTSGWLRKHGAALVRRRLSLLAAGMAVTALCYFGILWVTRDWLFDHVLRKQFPQRDPLLLLWGAVFLLIVIREQLVYLIAAQGRFRLLTSLTLLSAGVSMAISYWGMQNFGIVGALAGILAGELINVAGIVLLSALRLPARPDRSNDITAASSGVVRNSP